MRPVRSWSDYKTSSNLLSVSKFNPSTRRVTFDVHVDWKKKEVYVVLWVYLKFQTGDGDAPAWSTAAKSNFRKRMQASASYFEGGAVLQDAFGAAFQPFVFIEECFFGPYVSITAKTLRTAASAALTVNLLPPNNGVSAGTASYPRAPPAVSSGTTHGGVSCFLTEPAVQDFVVNGVVCNPFAHELGHMLGLPDEYNAFPPNGGMIPLAQTPTGWGWTDRAVFYWVKSLQNHTLGVPGWGHFGTGVNQVNDHSLMRNVAVGGGGVKPRHYVPIVEGVEKITAGITGSKKYLVGPWTAV